jgi:ribosomal protein L27
MSLVSLNNLSNAAKNAEPGSVIMIQNGTYKDQNVSLDAKGQKGDRVTITAETPGKVIFCGKSTFIINGCYTTVANLVFKDGGTNKAIKVAGDHNRLTSCDISYNSSSVERISQIDGFNCRVDHCHYHDFDKMGVYIVVSRNENVLNYALIDHNIFENRPELSGENNGMEAVRIGESATSLSNSRTIIEQNHFEKCDGEIEIISVKSCENIIRRNDVINCKGTITLRHGDRNSIVCNKICGENKELSGGIRIIGEDHTVCDNYIENLNGNGVNRVAISFKCGVKNSPINRYYQVKRALVDGNVIVNCNNAFAIGCEKKEANLKPIKSVVSNNIIFNDKGTELFSTNSNCIGSDDMVYKNNKMYGTKLGNHSGDNILLDPNTFTHDASSKVDKSKYGCNERNGLIYDVDPQQSELGMGVDEYYRIIRTDIPVDPIDTPSGVDTTGPVNISCQELCKQICSDLKEKTKKLCNKVKDLEDNVSNLKEQNKKLQKILKHQYEELADKLE